jgi:hypothetical protein
VDDDDDDDYDDDDSDDDDGGGSGGGICSSEGFYILTKSTSCFCCLHPVVLKHISLATGFNGKEKTTRKIVLLLRCIFMM